MAKRKRRYRDVAAIPSTFNGRNMDWRARHDSRKSLANRNARNAGIAFASIGGWLVIRNEGHHWQIHFPKMLVEWWPASAKLVIGQNWKSGIHVHRWQELFNYMRKETNCDDG